MQVSVFHYNFILKKIHKVFISFCYPLRLKHYPKMDFKVEPDSTGVKAVKKCGVLKLHKKRNCFMLQPLFMLVLDISILVMSTAIATTSVMTLNS